MKTALFLSFALPLFFAHSALAASASPSAPVITGTATYALDTVDNLKTNDVIVKPVTYLGKKAVQVTGGKLPEGPIADQPTMALVTGLDFQDGIIEVDLAGSVKADAPPQARGFVGIGFRAAEDFSGFEGFYIRPTNGRVLDQVRRNHATQYFSYPGYDFARFRQEAPEKYEAYADVQPDIWQHLKIEVKGETAFLYVNNAEQPALIVTDLKRGPSRGSVSLWVEPTTKAHFANLKITHWKPEN